MCRFLAIKSNQQINNRAILFDFSRACARSRTIEGDRQGDGWGVSWLDDDSNWQSYHSLQAIWKDEQQLAIIPPTTQLLVHARSASFDDHKNDVSVNQPYLQDEYAFAFNGVVYGVKLQKRVAGKTGSQKIFNLLKNDLQNQSPSQALTKTWQLLKNNSKGIKGFNCVLSNQDQLYIWSDYGDASGYFQLNYFKNQSHSVVCSERLPGFTWQVVKKKQIIVL